MMFTVSFAQFVDDVVASAFVNARRKFAE
jgi:hypothetical protein